MSVSMATKFGVYMGKIVKQNVPLAFQMGTFLNKNGHFKYFNYILHTNVGVEVFDTNLPKISHISLNNTCRA